MNELKLEVGKTYVDRRGGKVTITQARVSFSYPFLGSNLATYQQCGRVQGAIDNPYDLISEYVEPTPATPARTPHKWAAEMHAFADGYEIQTSWNSIDWRDGLAPHWRSDRFYRIKPEPAPLKPCIVKYIAIYPNDFSRWFYENENQMPNAAYTTIRIEFNPNDQTLVSAEVVTL